MKLTLGYLAFFFFFFNYCQYEMPVVQLGFPSVGFIHMANLRPGVEAQALGPISQHSG